MNRTLIIIFGILSNYACLIGAEQKRQVVIIGASRGIGLEICRQYRQEGYPVIAVCRTPNHELSEFGCQVIDNIDITEIDSICRLRASLEGVNIQVLILNAGIAISEVTPEAIVKQYNVNAVAPFFVLQALESYLSPDATVIATSSRLGSQDLVIQDRDKGWILADKHFGYSASKTALNMLMIKQATRWLRSEDQKNMKMIMMHPGNVKTDMNSMGEIDVQTSARAIIKCITDVDERGVTCFPKASGGQRQLHSSPWYLTYEGLELEW